MMDYFEMPFGPTRRKAILDRVKEVGCIYVNRKWQLQTKSDPDLKKLLKRGILKRERSGSLKRSQTRLVLA